MHVSVENISKLERKVRVELPQEKVSIESNNRLSKLAQTTKIDGFRPGKVPLKIIQGKYGEQVRQEVISELVKSSFYEAMEQEKLILAGPPHIADINDQTDKPLTYTATFEVYPEVVLAPVSDIAIERLVATVSDDDVSRMIESLRNQNRQLHPVDREAKLKDVVEIDFEGFIDGKEFTGGKAKNYQLELGSKIFLDGFEEGLLGKSAGEDITLKLKFPKDYSHTEVQGKQVEFKVVLHTVNTVILPDLDAEFMEKYGVKDGKKETFLNAIKSNMERELEAALKQKLKALVLDKLYTQNTFDLPQIMVSQERRRIQHELETRVQQQGLDAGTVDNIAPNVLTEQAGKRVALQIIVAEIVKQNELQIDTAKVRRTIENLAAAYADPNTIINWYYSDKQKLAQIEALVLENDVIDWVIASAKVTDKPSTFDEIMHKGQTSN